MRKVSVCGLELNFSYTRNVKAIQDKFDVLITTAKLMGYKIDLEDLYNRAPAIQMYIGERATSSKIVVIHFVVEGYFEKVQSVSIYATNRDPVYCKNEEKELLEELDKLLIYI